MNFVRTLEPGLEVATESFLPALPTVKTGIWARKGLNLKRLSSFLDILVAQMRPLSLQEYEARKGAGSRRVKSLKRVAK